MNERVMQFRIGMFVIVAGLVLTMLIVWFGESPTLFRNYRFLTVHYQEAPGAAPGIPVRKSGVRIGEIASIKFDDRPDKGDGVLVTLAIEPAFRLSGSIVPRIGRALIGDISLDILPGTDGKQVVLSKTIEESLISERIIEGAVTPDPANTLSQASQALEQAGPTLTAIRQAAEGVVTFSSRVKAVQELMTTWTDTGKKLGVAADDLKRVVAKNEGKIDPALTSMINAFEGISGALDEETQTNVRTAVKNLSASSVRLDKLLVDIGPLATDLGAPYGTTQTTQVGQVLTRLNRMAFEVGLLTAQFSDPSGKRLNPNGTLQKLVTDEKLYENLNILITAFREFLASADPVVRNMNTFTERIARDPSALGRGILDR